MSGYLLQAVLLREEDPTSKLGCRINPGATPPPKSGRER
jgi:hypothetical protein